jgi:tripartite-type tricarboxylate transporter receptor subunit TctC
VLARAQAAYPDKQIRMVIPFAPGGTTDLLARAVGQHMQETWGQPVVADNRAGANGVVAGEIVAKAAGDGYTLSTVAMGHAINPLIYRKLPYDGVNDFTPICLLATFPQLVLVHPALPVKTLADLIALAKTSAKPLTYGSGGNGSSQHLAGALFAHMAGLTLTHVAYKGGNPAQLDLMAGNLDLMIIQPNAREVVTSGKLRALAVSSTRRSPDYPDVPTVAESGIPGYQSVAWYGPGRPEEHGARSREEDRRGDDPRRRRARRARRDRHPGRSSPSVARRPSSPTSSQPSAGATRRSCARPG